MFDKKPEIGKVSKNIVDKMNVSIRCKADVNQWRSTKEVIRWFNNFEDKKQLSYLTFHIADFYPSITDDLLIKTLNWAQVNHSIAVTEFDAIMHARRTILYDHKGNVWTKKKSKNQLDVSMGANDGAEICELVGLYIHTEIHKNIDFTSVGLYRDDGLAVIRSASGSSLYRYRKKLITLFQDYELKITVKTGNTSINFLDINFCLNSESYQPYMKPNDEPLYIKRNSNHPPTILSRLPQTISKRISSLSSNFELFSRAAPIYNAALENAGYTERVKYDSEINVSKPPRNRKRNIIWYNPPYNKSVSTNIGRVFLNSLDKHFHKEHKLNKIFKTETTSK